MTTSDSSCRVLIADDDPISLRFLATALAQLGCDVVTTADGTAALAAVQIQQFSLLLLDRRMPGLGGAELLAALRIRDHLTPAVATSAEVDAAVSAQLHDAGFVDVIEKPATLTQLERVLSAHLPFSTSSAVPAPAPLAILNDASALAVIGGDAGALRALRGLLAQELVEFVPTLDEASDSAALRERLHRLRSSCGFCGAAALADEAVQLERALRDHPENAQPILCEFLHLCEKTLMALRHQALSTTVDARNSPSMPQARKPAPSR